MVKKVIGGYISVEEAAAEIEHLLTDGYTSSDIVVVTNSANKGALESLTVANVNPVADKKGVAKGHPNLFDYGDENNPLGPYNLGAETTEHYNKTIKHGGYVILSEQREGANGKGTDLNRSPIKTKSDPTLSNIGEVSESYRGKPTDTDEEPSLGGIPAKTSDKEQFVNEKNIPFSPGTPRDPSES
ncbi:general stress protein [Desemzia sp. RIT804]|uniref:general stress protein n=1 Tax=Desemzia sp. RIT 804 TaxID=2810209 RepID=UPI001951D370|nr:general stress protein [Desemzia sp. RIT 804]MBM6614663.1 general stress protein [Desemzia sp. RIT 804]